MPCPAEHRLYRSSRWRLPILAFPFERLPLDIAYLLSPVPCQHRQRRQHCHVILLVFSHPVL